METQRQPVKMNLAECRLAYQLHYGQPLPVNLPYAAAAERVRAERGEAKWFVLLAHIRENDLVAKYVAGEEI